MDNNRDLIKEIIIVVIAALFFGILLSLEISWPIINIGEFSVIKWFLLCLLMFGVFVVAQKFTAYKLDCRIKTKFITFRRFWFKKPYAFPFDFPAWFFLPLILTLISNGFINWLAILNFDIEPKPSRVRRRWQELTESDVGKIAISGPIAVLILGLFSKILGFTSFGILCAWLAFFALIPIGLGFKILNSTRLTWIFAFIFSIFILLLMGLTNTFSTIIIALLLTALATIAYYKAYEK